MVKWTIGRNTLTAASVGNTVFYGFIERSDSESVWVGEIHVTGQGSSGRMVRKDKSLTELMAWIEEELKFRSSKLLDTAPSM